MELSKLTGTGIALITPFESNGNIDFTALSKLVKHVSDGGVEYLVVMGTTGESVTLNKEEKQSILNTVVDANSKKLPIVLGVGGSNTKEVIEQIKQVDTSKVDAILSVSPYYNKPNQGGIYRHYMAIADASPLPIILYNVPGRTGSNMTAQTTLRLANHTNIIAMKEASGNFEQCMIIIKNKPADFLVISGDDALTLPFIGIGMTGVISVIGNAYPDKFSNMVRKALENNFTEARTLHYELLDAMVTIFADGSPGGIKEIMHHLNLCGTHVREPLYNVNAEVKSQLLEIAGKIK